MSLLDIRTLLLLSGLLWVVSGVTILLLRRMVEIRSATSWWGGACIIAGVGVILIGLQGIAPKIIALPVANGLLFSGGLFLWSGCRVFMNKRPLWGVKWCVFLFPLAAHIWFAYLDDRLVVRIVISMIPQITSLFLCASEFWWRKRRAYTLAGLLFGVMGTFYTCWTITSVFMISADTYLSSGNMSRILLLAGSSFQIFFIGCLTMLLGDRLHEDLAKAKEAAETANRAKSDFLAIMSHEIRTPMNAIMGTAEMLMESPSAQARDLRTIHAASESLSALLNDILDYSKIEAGEMEIEKVSFDLIEVMKRLEEICRLAASTKGLAFSVTVAPQTTRWLVGDSFRLGQILLNLTNNAMKFTPGGEVCVVSRNASDCEAALGETWLEFEVRDTGIGLNPQALDSLFKPFTQEDTSTTRTHGGAGLGLAICKRLVTLMGGTIDLDSKPHQGCTFTVTLPFALATDQNVDWNSVHNPPRQFYGDHEGKRLQLARTVKILLVEDTAINRSILTRMVQSLGAIVEAVENGHEALRNVSNAQYDLILMDLHMPQMSGIEVALSLQESLGSNAPIIVGLSADVTAKSIRKAREAGFVDYLAKPVSREALYACLIRIFPECAQESANNIGHSPGAMTLSGFDLQAALNDCCGDVEFYKIQLNAFRDRVEHFPDELDLVLAANDTEKAAQMLHSLKGTAALLKAIDFVALLEDFETALQFHSPQELRSKIPTLKGRCRKLRTITSRIL
ncbi:ATP-binding protein [Desulfovibrio inopinatus]|uniref:ATP-binding protein n=1 Tax=Desulfovibrio inopinatus TaxID=102109 RepID=UPI000411FA70|nr:ATP-binding protein [Desulfovibrio inopinatus]